MRIKGGLLLSFLSLAPFSVVSAVDLSFRLDRIEQELTSEHPNATQISEGVYRVSGSDGVVALVGFGKGGASYRAQRLRERLALQPMANVRDRSRMEAELSKLEKTLESLPKAGVQGLRCGQDWFMEMSGNFFPSGSSGYLATTSRIDYVGPIPPFGPPPQYTGLNVFASSTVFANSSGSIIDVNSQDSASAGLLGSASAVAIANCAPNACYFSPYATYAIAEATYAVEGCTSGFIEWMWTTYP